jgi:hypothetical protein
MKLRIRGNSIRLRLTQAEVEQIKNSGLVEEKVEFPNGKQIFRYFLSARADTDHPLTEFADDTIQVFISETMAQNWADSNEVGIYGTHGIVKIAIEKDFKCLTPRAGNDDADTFPHPKETC